MQTQMVGRIFQTISQEWDLSLDPRHFYHYKTLQAAEKTMLLLANEVKVMLKAAEFWNIQTVSQEDYCKAHREYFPITFQKKVVAVCVVFKLSTGVMQGVTSELCLLLSEQILCHMRQP